jgi:hypothetical protein
MHGTRYEQPVFGGHPSFVKCFFCQQQQQQLGGYCSCESWSGSQVVHDLLYQGVCDLDFSAEGKLP